MSEGRSQGGYPVSLVMRTLCVKRGSFPSTNRAASSPLSSRSPAIRAVDRLASANLRRLRMNGLRPGHRDCRTAVYQNCRCQLPPRGRIGNSALSILGRFGGNSYPGTCRKSSGACRCSVAVQNHWFQQLEVRKPLIQWRMQNRSTVPKADSRTLF